MNIRNLLRFLTVFLMLAAMCSCGVTKEAKKAINLANCDFRLVSADNIMIAGLPVGAYTSVKDLSVTDFAMIMGALTEPTLPLSVRLNVEVRNPNAEAAGINGLDYIIFIDDIQVVAGSFTQAVNVPATSSAVIPVTINTDLKQALKGKSMDAMLNFGFNLAGVGNTPTRFKIKLKPNILVGGNSLSYPGYITVRTEYSNGYAQ